MRSLFTIVALVTLAGCGGGGVEACEDYVAATNACNEAYLEADCTTQDGFDSLTDAILDCA